MWSLVILAFWWMPQSSDAATSLRTELHTKNNFGEPLVFGRVMDSEVKDDDRIAAIRTAIEMGKNFDVAQGYETQLIRGNYETYKPWAAPRLKELK